MSQAPFEYETLSWSAMTEGDRAAWRRVRTECPALVSPFFSLGWQDAVHSSRGDVEVIRITRNGEVIGFFPFTRCPFGVLCPVGAPMADWHGVVGPAGLSLSVDDILHSTRGRAFRYSGAAANDPMLERTASGTDTSFVMDLSDGYVAYQAAARKRHPNAFRNLRSRGRKLQERNVEIRLDDRDPSNLQMLLAMKRSQYRRTRQIDIFGFSWTRKLVETLFAEREAGEPETTRGLLSTLWIDGALAAGHFGLKDDATLHYWFPSYAARFADLSPGLVLLNEIARASSLLGVRRIDLGGGDYRYKREFANQHLPIISGKAQAAGWSRRAYSAVLPTVTEAANPPPGGIARITHTLTRRIDLLSSLHRWSPARP